jgi:hypothetical protein
MRNKLISLLIKRDQIEINFKVNGKLQTNNLNQKQNGIQVGIIGRLKKKIK